MLIPTCVLNHWLPIADVFEGAIVRGPYEKRSKNWRRYVVLVYADDRIVTMLYAKFLWVNANGVLPPIGYEIDHIDDDYTHDDIRNLQCISREANRAKQAKASKRIYIHLKCPSCGRMFLRSRSATHIGRDSTAGYTACSFSCRTKLFWSTDALASAAIGNVVKELSLSKHEADTYKARIIDTYNEALPVAALVVKQPIQRVYKLRDFVEVCCPNCETVFVRELIHTHLSGRNKSMYTACSYSCATTIRSTHGTNVEFEGNIVRVFKDTLKNRR